MSKRDQSPFHMFKGYLCIFFCEQLFVVVHFLIFLVEQFPCSPRFPIYSEAKQLHPMDPSPWLPRWHSASSRTCYLQLPDSFPGEGEVVGQEAAPIRALVGGDHIVQFQDHGAIQDLILDECGPVLELLHLLPWELLLVLVQVHHVGGLAPEPEDLHVRRVLVGGQVAQELHFFPDIHQDVLPRANHLDLL